MIHISPSEICQKVDLLKLKVPLSHVLWVGISGPAIDVHLLVKNRGGFNLTTVSASFQGDDPNTSSWVQSAMTAAYGGVKTRRRLLVIINPHGGPGKAASLFKGKVEPILKAARCVYKALYTESNGHAQKIASEIVPDEYDAVVSISGDGTLHEIVNGFAQHKEPMRALRLPIAPIPAGSGNGTCLNLLGIEDGLDVAYATLNVIKGRLMSIDLLSILQSGKRSLSFMSQCVGLMADLDLGTEHLRFMGSNRFVYGFVRGACLRTLSTSQVVTGKTYRFKISAKIGAADKVAMVETLRKHENSAPDDEHPRAEVDSLSTGLPPLQYVDDYDGWTTFEGPVLFFYAGKAPYMSRELMQFPVSIPSDGMVDLVIQGTLPRAEMMRNLLNGAEKGAAYWLNEAQYFKASAYRLGFLQEDGNLSIDGERFPFEGYYAEVHRGLGTVLSMKGRYAVDFALDPPSSM
ncbi:ATP-NAD kinase-like domain-containing protein [Lactarius pseudohatsudake]|nr:ATP-NAD kinase-like domain-containing protein [Lactarius pseudohatsudake]